MTNNISHFSCILLARQRSDGWIYFNKFERNVSRPCYLLFAIVSYANTFHSRCINYKRSFCIPDPGSRLPCLTPVTSPTDPRLPAFLPVRPASAALCSVRSTGVISFWRATIDASSFNCICSTFDQFVINDQFLKSRMSHNQKILDRKVADESARNRIKIKSCERQR